MDLMAQADKLIMRTHYMQRINLPSVTMSFETWLTKEASILPRSRKHILRDLRIYKLLVHDGVMVNVLSIRFRLTATHVKNIIRKLATAIESFERKEATTQRRSMLIGGVTEAIR